MDPESSGRFPSTLAMISSSEERIKMAPGRGTADRIWAMEDCRWPIDIVVSFYLPYWYLISRVFNFAFFAIVKKLRK